MFDGTTVVYEGLMALLGKQVRIESSRYPHEPAVGELHWVGYDGFAGYSAWVRRSPGVTRYVPLAHIAHFAEAPA